MKHRKPTRAQRAMASTSLPLATAAAVATLFAAPAGAVPNQPSTPTTPAPAPADPGSNTPTDQGQPETTKPDPGKPDAKPSPTPSQPGVTTPDPNQVMPNQPRDPKLSAPTQPGVTTPRVAPLPVPGRAGPDIPAVAPEAAPGADAPKPARPGTTAPGANTPSGPNARTPQQPQSDTLVQQPRWEAPRFQQAPAAPVVEMDGPHQEVGANIDGGSLAPGYVANTHHFNNASGYVGTIGYRTPTGQGEAGVSVEYVTANSIKVTSYTGGEGLADNKTEVVLDTTQANLAKAAVEHWIREQPGGAAALEAAAQVKLPVPPGELAPQSVNVAGVTTQWGGSLQY